MILLNPEYDDRIEGLIADCKSDSDALGTRLRNAHRELGGILGKKILEICDCLSCDITVICIMNSGLFFAEGIADHIDCPFLLLYDKSDSERNIFIEENIQFIENRFIILTDSVINTGNTIKEIYTLLSPLCKEVAIATNVIQSSAVKLFDTSALYAVRVSNNKFKGDRVLIQKGEIGPDTGDRLFKFMA